MQSRPIAIRLISATNMGYRLGPLSCSPSARPALQAVTKCDESGNDADNEIGYYSFVATPVSLPKETSTIMKHLPRRWSNVATLSLAALLAVGVAARAEDRPEHEHKPGQAEEPRGGHPEASHGAPAHVEAHPPGHVEPGRVQPGHVEPGRVQPGHVEPGRVQPGHVEPGRVDQRRVEPRRVEVGHGAGEHRIAEREHFVFHEHEVRRFSHEDMERWRGGRWRQTCDFGRCGWWWFAGGMWYFYDRPVYPYPMVVGEVTYIEPMPVAPPPVVVLPAPPPPPPPPVLQAAPQFWYWCDNPQGYYPYVQACSVEFRQVPVPVENGPPR